MAWTQVGGGAYSDMGQGPASLVSLFNDWGGESGYNMSLPQFMALFGYADLNEAPVTAPSSGIPASQTPGAVASTGTASTPTSADYAERRRKLEAGGYGSQLPTTPSAGITSASYDAALSTLEQQMMADQQAKQLEDAKRWVAEQARAGGTANIMHGYGVDQNAANFLYDLWGDNPYRLASRPSEQVFNTNQQFGRNVNTSVAGIPIQAVAGLNQVAGDQWKDYFDQQFAQYDGTDGKSAYSRALDDTIAKYAPQLSGISQGFGQFADKMVEAAKPIKTPISTVLMQAAGIPLAAFAGPALAAAMGGGMLGGVGAGAVLGGLKAGIGGGDIGMGALMGGLSPAISGAASGMLGGMGGVPAFDVAGAEDAFLGGAMNENYADMLAATADDADAYLGGAMRDLGPAGYNPDVVESGVNAQLTPEQAALYGLRPQFGGSPALSPTGGSPASAQAAPGEGGPNAQQVLRGAQQIAGLAKQVAALLGGGEQAQQPRPQRQQGQTDQEYASEVADWAVDYLDLDVDAMKRAGLQPGSPQYMAYILEQADSVIAQIFSKGGLEEGESVEDLQSALRDLTKSELQQLDRALYVRGELGKLMGAGDYVDPFTGITERVEGPGTFSTGRAAYQRGIARSTDELANLRGDEARQYLGGMLGRKADLYGLQSRADADLIRARLLADENLSEEERRRRMAAANKGDWAGLFEQAGNTDAEQLFRGVNADRQQAALLQAIFGE